MRDFSDVMCLVMDPGIAFDDLCDDIRDLCKFASEDVFTMKWIDEEGILFYFHVCLILNPFKSHFSQLLHGNMDCLTLLNLMVKKRE